MPITTSVFPNLLLSLNSLFPSPLPFHHQADAAALERLYDSMALETETLGLDSAAIRSLWGFYRSDGGGAVVAAAEAEEEAAGEGEGEPQER